MKKLLQIYLFIIVVVGMLSLILSVVHADDGYPYPDPTDSGYPIGSGYPVDPGYPITPVDPLYPEPIYKYYSMPKGGSPMMFRQELKAEIEIIKQVISEVQPEETSRVYQTWTQLVTIVKHYGKLLFRLY